MLKAKDIVAILVTTIVIIGIAVGPVSGQNKRLPTQGGDKDNWGTLLNEYLSQEHNIDGTHKLKTLETLTGVVNVRDFGAKADGVTDDVPAFEAARDYLVTKGGGVIYVPPGQYIMTRAFDLKNNISVIGTGWASNLHGRPTSPGTLIPMIYTYNIGNLTLSGLRFTHEGIPSVNLSGRGVMQLNSYGSTPIRLTVKGNFFDNIQSSAIVIGGDGELESFVENNFIINPGEHGIYVAGSKSLVIRGNIITGSGSQGIHTGTCGVKVSRNDAKMVLIDGNIIKNQNVQANHSGGGICVEEPALKVTIVNNQILTNGTLTNGSGNAYSSGIAISSDNNVVANNRILMTSGGNVDGIVVGGGAGTPTGNVIHGNTITGGFGEPLLIAANARYTVISGNTLEGTAGGWTISDSGDNTLIKDNVITAGGYGIQLSGSSDGDRVIDNVIASTAKYDVSAGPTNYIIRDLGNLTPAVEQYWAGKFTIGKDGTPISSHLSATAVWNPASLADGAVTSTTVTVSGAAAGDIVNAGHDQIGVNNVQISAHVESANTVRVILRNASGAILDLASGTLRVGVWKY